MHEPNPTSADADLQRTIDAAAAGDVVAFRALYDEHFEFVHRQVARIVGPRGRGTGEVEDVVQEVFVQVFRSLSSYRNESKFTTWLYRLTYNVAVSHLRKSPRTVQLADWRPLHEPIDTWAMLEARDLCRVLYAAIEQVPEDHREAFMLFEIEGLKLREIADLTGEQINTVAARVRRTRQRLQQILEQAGGRDD